MLLDQPVQSKLTLIGTYVYFARLKHQSHCNVQHIRKELMLLQVIDTLLRNHTIQVHLKLGDLHLNTTQKTQAKDVCIFCDNPAGSVGLHKASTFKVDFKVRTFATELCDTKLLAKLACGDMVAIDAQYHAKCLVKLYKRAQLFIY